MRPGRESGEWRALSPLSLRGALATKQSRIPSGRDSGLRRCARNDGASFVCAPSNSHFVCRHAFASSRRVSPEVLPGRYPPNPRGRREGRVPAGTRGLLREKHTQKRPHSSIQVSPITRPSLRSGWTAYAVISREPTILLASLAPRIWMMQSARLGSLAPSQKLDRSNDGQDHTVLPYARPAISPQYSLTPSTEPETYRRDEA